MVNGNTTLAISVTTALAVIGSIVGGSMYVGGMVNTIEAHGRSVATIDGRLDQLQTQINNRFDTQIGILRDLEKIQAMKEPLFTEIFRRLDAMDRRFENIERQIRWTRNSEEPAYRGAATPFNPKP